ncbi:P13 [Chrysodeixis includens nucleopolyhedrovirus]|uniref:P13 n=1 Tax=Chrysodeixis includens nucleopolyhedrovirus TaxID=1207438 RepID=A0A5B8YTR0_9ABAC|nr:P13 [Chrysodeixis includens nucleopolyhedrovirus]QED40618.1 P13 [Chrysodeixis includens nucleopolyhedrovirus]
MYAYVTLVMLGDEYVKGAVVLAKSLLLTNTRYDLVCMVTKDVSSVGVSLLHQYFNYVIPVDYITYNCPPMITKRQNQMYGGWINNAFTKWQCLTLKNYKKIVYLDADHVVVKNIDHLFFLPAPALCFADDGHGYYYNKLVGRDVVTPKNIESFFRYNKILCRAGTVLLEPSNDLLDSIRRQLNNKNNILRRCLYHNGFDEQVLLQAFMEQKMCVTQLCILYAWNAGSYHKLRKSFEPYIINYYGDEKPWHYSINKPVKYMDVFIWKYFNAYDIDIKFKNCKQTVQ